MVKTKISFSLDKNLNCENVCNNIRKLINSYIDEKIDLSNYLLVFELKEITNSNQSLLPRIGVKNE